MATFSSLSASQAYAAAIHTRPQALLRTSTFSPSPAAAAQQTNQLNTVNLNGLTKP
jgi:hypothetical protein